MNLKPQLIGFDIFPLNDGFFTIRYRYSKPFFPADLHGRFVVKEINIFDNSEEIHEMKAKRSHCEKMLRVLNLLKKVIENSLNPVISTPEIHVDQKIMDKLKLKFKLEYYYNNGNI